MASTSIFPAWLRKALLVGALLYGFYLAGGVALLAMGRLDRLFFWPGWSVKGPHATRDKSGFEADGPIVFYQHNLLISKSIAPRGQTLTLLTDTFPASALPTLTCFASETGQSFEVPLRVAAAVPADTCALPAQLLAVSDIEGNFKGFTQLLRNTGVVDAQLAWHFGQGHLVLVGDFFDRGLNVTECLWLIYKLEQEAAQAGGAVHFIMGNHERMNLLGQHRYVRRKYRVNADTLGRPYAQWYDRSTVLGRWLRTKNVAEKIGSFLFVHGGISPELAATGISLRRLNDLARASLDTPATHPLSQQVTRPPGSPDWYRGLVQETPTEAQVAQVLATYAATCLVVGHTPVKKVQTLYHGRVIAIDMPHQQRTDAGQPLQTLWLENGQPHVVDSRGHQMPL
ncbi:MAG: metallophosphoesterase [Hymenobacter sp.]|nr:MAG: metallophosphoesterase [Hymenobacter sp.]